MNDLNVLDVSPLYESFVNGRFTALDKRFKIAGEDFDQLYYLVDGIYPELSRFVKTIPCPINAQQANFAKWQESTRKDVERCFGVLQQRFQILGRPLQQIDLHNVHHIVECCIILHNMLVQDRVNGTNAEFYDPSEKIVDIDDESDEFARNAHGPELINNLPLEVNIIGAGRGPFEHQHAARTMWSSIMDKPEHMRLQRALSEHLFNNQN